MRQTFENVIGAGGFDLAKMLGKIDVCWAEGKLTDGERNALAEKARGNANPADSLPDAAERLAAAELRVAELEKRIAALENPTVEEPEEGEPAEVILPYKQPTGAHDAYGEGAKIVWTDGNVYESTIPGNVWDPLTYPQGWALVGPAPEPDPEPAE